MKNLKLKVEEIDTTKNAILTAQIHSGSQNKWDNGSERTAIPFLKLIIVTLVKKNKLGWQLHRNRCPKINKKLNLFFYINSDGSYNHRHNQLGQ